jgi:HSP90 family molecular chaperone
LYEIKQGETLSIPLVHTLRSEFSGNVIQLKTFGPGWEGNPPFDISIADKESQAKLQAGAIKAAPGDYTIAFYGPAVAKYRYNPLDVLFAQSQLDKAELALKNITEELAQKTQQASNAPAEQKAAADAAVAECLAKKMAADTLVAAAKETLKQAQARAEPRDTAEIIVSEPITVRVLPAT